MKAIKLKFPFVPKSAKNRSEIRVRGSKRWISKSKQAERDQSQMAAIVRALNLSGIGETFFGDHYVGVRIVVDEDQQETSVEIVDLGPQPTKGRRYTKRDVHGVVESIMDGIEGHVFDNDRQVRWCTVRYSDWEIES